MFAHTQGLPYAVLGAGGRAACDSSALAQPRRPGGFATAQPDEARDRGV
ncbi:hypothetical protein [Rubrivivax gelatinosus]|nr:hypothetical protein [Rubrivivax gelatinosus]